MLTDAPILVTGSHRSGTTWIGRCLSLSQEVGFIWEPFSPSYSPPFLPTPARTWFLRVTANESCLWQNQMSDLLKFRYRPLHKLRFLRSPRLIVKACRDAFQIEAYRLRRLRPLLKDPIALMSADWLQATFGLKVILAVRHPAAFVESMKRQRDSHPWSDFIQQAALMDNELQGYAEQILAAEAGYLSSLEQHILLWNILYGFVRLKLSQGHDWIVVRHEDLSRDPAEEFRSLYKQVGLSYTSDIKSRLLADRMSGISDKWKTCLQKSEIRAVRIGTEHVWQGRFYADSDWV